VSGSSDSYLCCYRCGALLSVAAAAAAAAAAAEHRRVGHDLEIAILAVYCCSALIAKASHRNLFALSLLSCHLCLYACACCPCPCFSASSGIEILKSAALMNSERSKSNPSRTESSLFSVSEQSATFVEGHKIVQPVACIDR
jgi:hypothetical protein